MAQASAASNEEMTASLAANPGGFDIFAKLPRELRNRIWKFAASEPRILTISSFPHLTDRFSPEHFYSVDTVPAVLYTCQESRSEALAFYTKAFVGGPTGQFIWTNFDADTIKIRDYRLPRISKEDRARIQWMMVEITNDGTFYNFVYPESLEPMVALQDLMLATSPRLAHQWAFAIGEGRRKLQRWFGGTKGWKCPSIRMVDEYSHVEINLANCPIVVGRERWALGLELDSGEDLDLSRQSLGDADS
jgi:hypothetical protein